MAATYLASSAVATQFTTNADPWSITGPAGSPAAGDWVVVCTESVNGASFTPPAGFTTDTTAVEGTTDGRGRNFYGKFATVGAGPYSFDADASRAGLAIVGVVRGADQTTPLDLASTVRSGTTSTTAWSGTSQTTVTAGACIITFEGCSPNGATVQPWTTTNTPSGATEALESSWTDHSMAMSFYNQAAAGAVSLAGTFAASEPTWTIQMAFRPAPAAVRPKKSLRVMAGTSRPSPGSFR